MYFKGPKSCPYCGENCFIKKGYYRVRILNSYRKRYFCKSCLRTLSNPSRSASFRQKRPDLNEKIRSLLSSGVTQRDTARLLSCSKNTVDRKLKWLALNLSPIKVNPFHTLFIDEMETIEHTKLKPVTLPLAVTDQYQILSMQVGRIPAKGHSAKVPKSSS